jgi:Na+-driven multidrug efflux pump
MKRGENKFFCRVLKNCNGIVSDYLPWLLLAVIALVLFMVSIFVMRGEGNSIIDKIKNLFRFR